MKLSRTDNSPFSYDFEKEKSHRNKTARTEESESHIPFERAAKDSAMNCSYTNPCVRNRYRELISRHSDLKACHKNIKETDKLMQTCYKF